MAKKKYKIVYKREECIGAASCVGVLPEVWSLNDDGKADLAKAEEKEGNKIQELVIELEESQLEQYKHSAEVCPVNVIHIYDAETGEQIY